MTTLILAIATINLIISSVFLVKLLKANSEIKYALETVKEQREHREERAVSQDSRTSKDALALLAEHKDFSIRINVAENDNAPDTALTALASDEDWRVRELASKALNPRTNLGVADRRNRKTGVRK